MRNLSTLTLNSTWNFLLILNNVTFSSHHTRVQDVTVSQVTTESLQNPHPLLSIIRKYHGLNFILKFYGLRSSMLWTLLQ